MTFLRRAQVSAVEPGLLEIRSAHCGRRPASSAPAMISPACSPTGSRLTIYPV